MKGSIFALVGMLLYAGANVVMDGKLARYNNLTIMSVYGLFIAGLAFALRQLLLTRASTGDALSYAYPSGMGLLYLVVLGVLFFGADYFFIGAYTNGARLVTVTSISLLFPVFASLVEFIWSRVNKEVQFTPPTLWHIAGYVLGCVAVFLVLKGNAVRA